MPARWRRMRHAASRRLLRRRGVPAGAANIRFGFDPLGSMAAAGVAVTSWGETAARSARSIAELAGAGFKGPFLVADGRAIHNAGGSEAQELGFVLAVATAYLRALEGCGIGLEEARAMIWFRLTADADQFLSIAKLRALRRLWGRIEEACGLAAAPVFISAETAWRMMTRHGPYVNMLRSTIAVFSAALGGADAVTVLPFTLARGLPDRFARRTARNAQLVLLAESHLAKVADPAAGAGVIEDLTEQLCVAAWALLQEIERSGGAAAALEQGLIQKKVAARARRAASRIGAAHRHAHRHQRLCRAGRARGRGARRRPGDGGGAARRRDARAAAVHPPGRTVRGAARCLRPDAGADRRAPENLPRQSGRAGRFLAARQLRRQLLRGRRHRGGDQ